MCITGSDFNCPQAGWRPCHIPLKGRRSDSLCLLKSCYLFNMLGCLDACTAQHTDNHNQKTSPHRSPHPVRLESRHATPTGALRFKESDSYTHIRATAGRFSLDNTTRVCFLRRSALWPCNVRAHYNFYQFKIPSCAPPALSRSLFEPAGKSKTCSITWRKHNDILIQMSRAAYMPCREITMQAKWKILNEPKTHSGPALRACGYDEHTHCSHEKRSAKLLLFIFGGSFPGSGWKVFSSLGHTVNKTFAIIFHLFCFCKRKSSDVCRPMILWRC